ncbi:multidrug transporter membrane ATP-binding component [Nitzschia inconspicua]|uniref:Multidrug transporter membrane ATP-binding component n=1 Tax=Nitzschia inconspicua TaxID=303405 RepID=A0A9K3LCC0_9STRA|nr:multidrug transporter membrane ATP-binding component [Nitzschia inconspicua]
MCSKTGNHDPKDQHQQQQQQQQRQCDTDAAPLTYSATMSMSTRHNNNDRNHYDNTTTTATTSNNEKMNQTTSDGDLDRPNQHHHQQQHHQRLAVLNRWPEDPLPKDCNEDVTASSSSVCCCSTSTTTLPPFYCWLYRIYSNWTYSYMNVVLSEGARQNKLQNNNNNVITVSNDIDDSCNRGLTTHDLFVVPRSIEASLLMTQMEEYYDNDVAAAPTSTDPTDPTTTTTTSSTSYRQKRRRLLKTLWKIAAPMYIPAGICELLVVICGTTLPLLVRDLLRILENNPNQNITSEGLPWALSIALVSVINGLGNHRHRHLALKTGVALRAAVVNIIYQHVLQLSPQGKHGLTSGEITNLVAVDAQKLFEVTQEGHLIWALPLSIILVTFFLYQTLGPSVLVGIVVLIGFLPLINMITNRMMQVRMKRVRYSDQRVEIVSNMLQGIKVTKLNNYEHSYEERIKAVRDQELKYLKQEMFIWASTMLITVCSPMLATASCFATYVLLDENNILTAADTFGVLLLFSALRFPINFAGRLIGRLAQALSAVRRIALFLERPLRRDAEDTTPSKTISEHPNMIQNVTPQPKEPEEGPLTDTSSADTPLELREARFRIGATPSSDDSVNGNNNNIDGDGDDDGSDHETNPSSKALSMDLSSRSNAGTSFTVSEFNFALEKGQVLAVCGPVGSGKSTLLNGILGEAEPLGPTKIIKRGQFSYAPQDPFILNESLRDNILFGLPYEEDRYNRVLDACALRPDVEQLGGSDSVQIGERGVTLSGGQRQRVSLARAAYAKSSCVILDDPFSALDSGTGKQVFERLIAAPDAFFKDSAVLLVTHASHFISHRAVNKILLMVQGKNRFYGTWDELSKFAPSDEVAKRAVDHINSQVRENTEESDSEEEDEEGHDKREKHAMNKETKKKKIMQKETREHGVSSLKTWLLWFRRAGGIWFMGSQIFFLTIDRFAYVAVEWFLAQWTSGAYAPVVILGVEFPAQTDGLSAQAQYLKVFSSIILLSVIATALRSEWVVTGGARATKNVFYSMVKSVLRAPLSYFETVPMGRILNRFTYDTDINDVTLTQIMSMFVISCSWYVAGVCIQIAILPWTAAALFPVSGIYWLLMLHYRHSGPDLQRIDALSRSPLQSMVSECLEGSTSIRVFCQDKNFTHRFHGISDTNSSALLNFVSAQRWLGVRMEMLGSVIVLVSTVLLVCLNDTLNLEPGLAGLLIMWSSNFTVTLNFLVDTFSETEAAITAIERVDAMADLPSEKTFETAEELQPPKDWPEKGVLEFDNVSLRYREGLPLALNGLSFKISSGQTCGVVGRTGAGKSSITVALFRLVEIESGRILLDGVDLSTLGLSDVRGRGMSIIPQDPFLAGATLRECLDPFGKHSDTEIMDALESVRLGSSSVDPDTLLSTKLEEGGSNYSVGERQLLNLARALLSQPKLLVLDEATASIDGETDSFIQRMLRTRFPNTTLVTIAHRLNTIMDYDVVLVMDKGRAAEYGSPDMLLSKKGGVFSELVDATGAESSKALRQLANEAAARRGLKTED